MPNSDPHDTHLYAPGGQQLEVGTNQDEPWNAAQLVMVLNGKMHGCIGIDWA